MHHVCACRFELFWLKIFLATAFDVYNYRGVFQIVPLLIVSEEEKQRHHQSLMVTIGKWYNHRSKYHSYDLTILRNGRTKSKDCSWSWFDLDKRMWSALNGPERENENKINLIFIATLLEQYGMRSGCTTNSKWKSRKFWMNNTPKPICAQTVTQALRIDEASILCYTFSAIRNPFWQIPKSPKLIGTTFVGCCFSSFFFISFIQPTNWRITTSCNPVSSSNLFKLFFIFSLSI